MRNIFDELWYGNMEPYTECRTRNDEIKDLERYIERHKNKLEETMTDTQKEIFEKFDDCCQELIDINERMIFSYAFKLGAKISIEILTDHS